jgi:hypothetical protein
LLWGHFLAIPANVSPRARLGLPISADHPERRAQTGARLFLLCLKGYQ